MTLAAFYVLVSRVRTFDSLRLLQRDEEGLRAVAALKHDELLAAWERGYDTKGHWSDALAVAALKDVRRARMRAKQVRADTQKARSDATAARKRSEAAREAAASAAPPSAPAPSSRKDKMPSPSIAKKTRGKQPASRQSLRTAAALHKELQVNLSCVQRMGLPALAHPELVTLPPWWTSVQPSLKLRARVVDYWAADNEASQQVVDHLRRLGFTVDFDTSRRQEPSACSFVAARTVNDMHTAGEAWWTCDVRRAADHEWVRAGNLLLGRSAPGEVDSGFMAGGEQVEALVRGFWQNDAPTEPCVDLAAWLPLPCATALDAFLVELAKDLQAAAAKGSLPLRLRVANTELSTSRGLHWFTVAYQIQRLEVLARRSVATGAGKRRAVSRTTNGDEDCELISLGAPDASDDDDSLGGFISDDGSDWRAQVERVRQTDRRGGRPDMHHARIEAGLDPGAGADEASEDDVHMYDTPARSSHFVDDEASDEDDID